MSYYFTLRQNRMLLQSATQMGKSWDQVTPVLKPSNGSPHQPSPGSGTVLPVWQLLGIKVSFSVTLLILHMLSSHTGLAAITLAAWVHFHHSRTPDCTALENVLPHAPPHNCDLPCCLSCFLSPATWFLYWLSSRHPQAAPLIYPPMLRFSPQHHHLTDYVCSCLIHTVFNIWVTVSMLECKVRGLKCILFRYISPTPYNVYKTNLHPSHTCLRKQKKKK